MVRAVRPFEYLPLIRLAGEYARRSQRGERRTAFVVVTALGGNAGEVGTIQKWDTKPHQGRHQCLLVGLGGGRGVGSVAGKGRSGRDAAPLVRGLWVRAHGAPPRQLHTRSTQGEPPGKSQPG